MERKDGRNREMGNKSRKIDNKKVEGRVWDIMLKIMESYLENNIEKIKLSHTLLENCFNHGK